MHTVIKFNISQDPHILTRHEINRHTLPPEPPRPANSVDIVLTITRQIVVDDQRHLLHVDSARPHIRRDEDPTVPLAKVLHDAVALLLRHFAVHAAHGEVRLPHLLREPVDLAPRVAEDDGLGDGQGVVEIAQGVELPLLLLDGDEVLFEAFEGELVALDEDAHGVGHELCGHVEDVVGEGGGDDDDLGGGGEVAVDVVDLLAEAAVEELVGLVEDEHFDVRGLEVAATDHVGDATGRAGDDVLAVFELADVFADVGAADARVALHVHVVAEGHDDGLDLGCEFAGGGEDEGCGGLVFGGGRDRDRGGGQPWVWRTAMSMTWRMEMEKVAVLPVPDWAWAMVSRPLQIWTMARDWTADGDS